MSGDGGGRGRRRMRGGVSGVRGVANGAGRLSSDFQLSILVG